MRPTFRLVLHPPVRADGTLTVYLRVSFRHKNKFFSLHRRVLPEQWEAESGRLRKNYPGHAVENDVLRTIEQRAADTLRDWERDNKPFSFEEFEAVVLRFRGSAQQDSPRFHEYLMQVRQELSDSGKFGNSQFYRNAAATVKAFTPNARLEDITADWLKKCEGWMRKTRGMADGGISVCMRVIRAACNRAIKEKLQPRSWYPFADYSIGHLKSKNVKRAITLDEMRRFEEYQTEDWQEHLAVDLFLFSFYCRGMNLSDIAELTTESIQSGRIVYSRKKTGGYFTVPLKDKAVSIIARHARPGEDYLFPIFTTGTHVTAQQKFNRMHKITGQVNAALKYVARKLDIRDEGFVFYTARHTYATALKHRGVSVDVISQALGHADLRTTELYLKSFGDDVLDRADALLD